jgi:hypothetical protein
MYIPIAPATSTTPPLREKPRVPSHSPGSAMFPLSIR